MRFAPALYFSFVASAFAYRVTSPSEARGWSASGPQTLSWERVDTDPTNFTAVLTNEDRDLLPTDQVLAALVDGTKLTIQVNPPSGGWPIGESFRVNIVRSAERTDTILAQSSEFAIEESTSSTSSGTSSHLSTTRAATATPLTTATNTAGSNVNTAPPPSASDPSSNPPESNAALPFLSIQSRLVSAFAVLGLFLA